ncbi:hypothetical protein GCM10011374_30330 [Kocuria dechangensis]|uniref:Uncharacterized protein n=1 Tax=Kocuria dechangensis TaxID=1176249 RepID=A0A917H1K2_9MICC|nr:hypothetical protein [Kocuria dechangensis]GGG64600.1 hypothetical protein GCM10011374_30330 [Kocuria dechangensis]
MNTAPAADEATALLTDSSLEAIVVAETCHPDPVAVAADVNLILSPATPVTAVARRRMREHLAVLTTRVAVQARTEAERDYAAWCAARDLSSETDVDDLLLDTHQRDTATATMVSALLRILHPSTVARADELAGRTGRRVEIPGVAAGTLRTASSTDVSARLVIDEDGTAVVHTCAGTLVVLDLPAPGQDELAVSLYAAVHGLEEEVAAVYAAADPSGWSTAVSHADAARAAAAARV